MYKANREGTLIQKDIVQTYAWLQLSVDSSPGLLMNPPHLPELNGLALEVDVATSQAGKRLAADYKAGHWPTLKILPPQPAVSAPVNKPVQFAPPTAAKPITPPPGPRPDPGLKLNGILYGATRSAVINNKSVTEGDTVVLPFKPKPVTVTCIKIEPNSVIVTLDGEDYQRRVSLK